MRNRSRWILPLAALVALGLAPGCVGPEAPPGGPSPPTTTPVTPDTPDTPRRRTELNRDPPLTIPSVVHGRILERVGRAPVVPAAMPTLPQPPVVDVAEASSARRRPSAAPSYDGRLLVVSADGGEASLTSIRQVLDYLGTPYTVWIASERAGQFGPAALRSATRGLYQGVILATGSLAYTPDGGATWRSAFTAAEWQALWDYEAEYRVRQVTWYTLPTADYGFGPTTAVDSSAAPVSATLTTAGRAVFATVNAANPVMVRNAWTYLAPPLADGTTVPLLTDAAGHALAVVRTWPDGRQNLALTFDSNRYLLHSLQLSFGLVNWVSRGLFVGERHTYMTAHVDDFFLADELWGGGEYRMTADDLSAVVYWQRRRRVGALAGALRLDIAFNGQGSTGTYVPDTLTPYARRVQADFRWVNHTYTHLNLNQVSYATARFEVAENLDVARSLGLAEFERVNLVTGQVSGLYNADAMRAAFDVGVRYIVSDTSRPGEDNPTPNAGSYNALAPGILQVPRRPNNLFYNVTTPHEWASEYNFLYRGYWGRDLSYAEILDRESDVLLQYMLRSEIDPWMFHQTNLRAYDGTRTLLTDLLDRTIEKYAALTTLPLVSPSMDRVGASVAARMTFDRCGVAAVITPGYAITLRTTGACTVPVTGLSTGRDRELYGGQPISRVAMRAGQTVNISLR